jgi:anti-sigma-K factor RskA
MKTQDRFADWDAMYLLGGLEADERREFETHLDECDSCMRAVAELAGLPGLLAKVSPDDLLRDDRLTPAPPADFVDRVVRELPPRPAGESRPRRSPDVPRIRRMVLQAAAVVVAVAAAAAITFAVTRPNTSSPSTVAQRSMTSATTLPMSAEFALLDDHGQTRIQMICRHGQSPTLTNLGMWVTTRDGLLQQLAQWDAGPNTQQHLLGVLQSDPRDITSVSVRSAQGNVLLTAQA